MPDVELARTSWWSPLSVSFLLPIRERQRVVVVGAAARALDTVRSMGAEVVAVAIEEGDVVASAQDVPVVRAERGAIPLPTGYADHVVVPVLRRRDSLRLVVDEPARLLRPGGSLFVGIGASWRSATGVAARLCTPTLLAWGGRRVLERRGFENVRAYGIHPSLQQPRHIVPLDSRQAVSWYARCGHLPQTRVQAATGALLLVAPRLPRLLLFRAVGLTARRREGGAP
jgi:hypothetical protein